MKRLWDFDGDYKWREGHWYTSVVGDYIVWYFEYYVTAGAIMGPQLVSYETVIGKKKQNPFGN